MRVPKKSNAIHGSFFHGRTTTNGGACHGTNLPRKQGTTGQLGSCQKPATVTLQKLLHVLAVVAYILWHPLASFGFQMDPTSAHICSTAAREEQRGCKKTAFNDVRWRCSGFEPHCNKIIRKLYDLHKSVQDLALKSWEELDLHLKATTQMNSMS